MDSGIYCFKNRVTGDCYVGQSIHIRNRQVEHLRTLRRGYHASERFQQSFGEHGEAAFDYSVLEYCHRDVLREREWYWLLTIRPTLNMVLPNFAAIDRGVQFVAGTLPGKSLKCEMCSGVRKPKERFCSVCKSMMKENMWRDGYLKRLPWNANL